MPCKRILPLLLLVLAGAMSTVPVHAATWQIGPAIGFDVFTSSGSSSTLTNVALPIGPDLFNSGVRPGLRIGVWDASLRHEVFLDTGVMVWSGSSSTLYTLTNTLNYAYAFHEGSSPYVTAGAGFATVGGDISTDETFTILGLGLGHRQRLSHGHGSIRVEARYDRVDSDAALADALNVIGFRVGFDLDLN